MLDGIIEDITKDKAASKAEEDAAQAEFDTFKKESLAQIAALEKARNSLIKTKGDKEDDVGANKKLRLTSRNELEVIMQTIKDAEPFCDYVTINYRIKHKVTKLSKFNSLAFKKSE
jgi:hypothetical protein